MGKEIEERVEDLPFVTQYCFICKDLAQKIYLPTAQFVPLYPVPVQSHVTVVSPALFGTHLPLFLHIGGSTSQYVN